MGLKWLGVLLALLLLAAAGAACGENDTNQRVDEARGTAAEAPEDAGSPAVDETELEGTVDETAGEGATPDEAGAAGEEEAEGPVRINIRSPEDGAIIAERRPTLEVVVRNARMRNG